MQHTLPLPSKSLSGSGLGKEQHRKLGLLLASLAAAAYLWGFKSAAVTIIAIYTHELGHLLAMKRRGIPNKGIWFVPFFGGFVQSTVTIPSRDIPFVFIMGPIGGALVVPFLVMLALLAGLEPKEVYEMGFGMVFLNLFNMVPFPPLDGGRIMSAIGTGFRFPLLGVVLAVLGVAFFGFLGWHEWDDGGLSYCFLSVLCVLGIGVTLHARKENDGPPMSRWRSAAWLGGYLVTICLLIVALCALGTLTYLARQA